MIESTPTGVRLHLLIQPKASQNEIVGPHDGALKVRIQAPPIDGKANETLIEFLAKTFGVSKRAVRLVKGEASRRKTVEIDGLSLADLEKRIEAESTCPVSRL